MTSFSAIRKILRTLAGIACLLAVTASPLAAPWIDPSDVRLRHHIQVLADAGLIRVPVNTWPLMWSGIIRELGRARGQVLTPAQTRAIAYIDDAFRHQTQPMSLAVSAIGAEQINPIRGFGDTRREQSELTLSGEYLGEAWAGRITVTRAEDPLDDKSTRLDGSYLAALVGNWALVAGSLDRWWGPSWENGLILSSNARPVPALALQRNDSGPFQHRWLHWLGPWNFIAFAGQLESERAVPDAWLFGMRFEFRPLPWLDIGLSRTAQWGGEGRPETLSSFGKLLLGKDNVGDAGTTSSNEPGNQLAGFDWRANWAGNGHTASFYGEMIGEDEAGGLPSKYMGTLGLDWTGSLGKTDLRVYLETTETSCGAFGGSEQGDCAYEHYIYRTGYRYRGLPIGSGMDNDSKMDTLGLQWYPSSNNSVSLRASRLELNIDGTGFVIVDGNSVSSGASEGWRGILKYEHRWRDWNLGLSYVHYDGDLSIRRVDTGDDFVEAAIRWQW